MRGIIQGSLWGLIVGVVGLSVASLSTEQTEFATGPRVPQIVTPELATVETSPAVALEMNQEGSPGFVVVTPLDVQADSTDTTPDIATAPAEKPPVGDAGQTDEAPAPSPQLEVASAAEEPVARPAQSNLEEANARVREPVVETTPAPLVAEPADPVVQATSEPVEPESAVSAEVDDRPAAEEPAEVPAVTDLDVPSAEEAPMAPANDEVPAVAAEPEELQSPTPEVARSPQPVIVAQALPQANAAVRVNRPGTAPEETEVETNPTPDAEMLADDAPALRRYAVPFENAAALPVISVLLVDTGEMDASAVSTASLGFVPTVAINALAADATSKVAAYQAAGAEIAMQLDLPDGARPADVEVAFAAAFELLPDAAMLFSFGSGAIEDRSVIAQVMEILAADGHGFVAVRRGLGNSARAADQAGVPAATVLRDLDGGGEDRRAILRALDQAAFRARQTGDVVLLGRVRPETLDALREWAAGLDQQSLAIAPVSAILLRAE